MAQIRAMPLMVGINCLDFIQFPIDKAQLFCA